MTAPHIERSQITLPDPESRYSSSGPERRIPVKMASPAPAGYQPRSVSGRPINQDHIGIGRVPRKGRKA